MALNYVTTAKAIQKGWINIRSSEAGNGTLPFNLTITGGDWLIRHDAPATPFPHTNSMFGVGSEGKWSDITGWTYQVPENAVRAYVLLSYLGDTETKFVTDENESRFGGFFGGINDYTPLDFSIRYIDADNNIIPITSVGSDYTGKQTYFIDHNTEYAPDVSVQREYDMGYAQIYPANPYNIQFASTSWASSYYQMRTDVNPYYFRFNNIRVFIDQEKGDEWLRTGIDDGSGRAPGDHTTPIPDVDRPYEGVDSPIGIPYDETEFNTVGIDNDAPMSRTLLLSKTNMTAIANALYGNIGTSIEDILEGLKMYGEQPMSFIVDAFYLPINPNPWISSSATDSETNFGSLKVGIGNHTIVKGSAKVVTMGNVQVSGAYNDFRDYVGSNYYIYLPFAGIYNLDIEKYMYHTLSIKVFFDVRTGSMKYYLCADGKVQDMYECSIRQGLPMTSSDSYQNAMNKISSAVSAVGGAVSVATGNVINGAIAIGTSALEMSRVAPKHCSGGFTPQASLVDSLDIMLWIEQKEIVYPENLKNKYGLPDNKVTTLGSLTGYVQIDDIFLASTQSENRKNKLINELMSEGLIL